MPSKVERWLASQAKEQEGTATDKIRADRAIDSGSEEFRVGAELDRYVGKASALAPYSPAPTTAEQPTYVEQTPLERKEQKLVSAARQRAEKRKTAGDDFYKKEYGMTKAEYDKEYDAIDRMSAVREARSNMQEIEDTAKARAEEKVALAPLVKEYKDAFIGILPESAYAGYSPVGDKEEIKEDIVLNYLMTLPAEQRYAQLEKAAYRSTIVPRIEALKEKATQFMNEEAERIIEMQKHVPVPGYAGAAGMVLGAGGTWESPVEYLEDLYTSVKKDDFKSGFVEAADWRDFISFGLASLGGDAAKLQALHKAYKGEPLTEQDKFFIEVAEIEQALEDFRTEKGGASSWNSLGSGAAHSSQFMTEMLMTGGLGGAAKVATGGIKQAFKQGVGRGFAHLTLKNVPKTLVYGAKRSPLMAGLYRNLMDRRINQYSVANGQVDLTKPESLWKSIGVAWVDQTFEIASELWGNMLHLGFGKIGKAIGADKWLKTKSVSLKTTPAMRRIFRDGLLWSGDIPSEMTSEFLGDVATNLAYSAFNKDEQYWGELFTWNYWGNLLALTAGLKAGVTVASIPSIVASNKKVKQLEARSAESFNAIGNEELKGKVLNLGGRTDIEDVAEYMSSIDWSQYEPVQVAHAIDYMMSEVERQVVAGSESEQERAERYAPRLARIQELAYLNAEGVAMPTMITAEANFGVDNTQGVTILEGDYNNPEAMVRVRLADGTTDVVLGEKLSNVVETDMSSLVAEDYAMTFAEEDAMETLGEVEQTLFDMQRTGASNTQQIRAVEKAGLTVFNEGEVVTLLNGEEATVVEGFRHGLYTVMRADGSLSMVGVGGILQPDVAMAQAQRSAAMPQEQTPLTQSAPLPEDIDTTTDYATPDGFVGKAVDYNAESDQVTLQSADGGLTNVPRASLTAANAEQIAPQEDITENLATETISEMEQGEAEEAPMPVAPQTAPIPQNEDGSVDYESMTDATMYANALESDMGNVADAQEAVADVRQSKEAELAKLQEQKKQTANMNEKVALRQQEQRLVQQIAMLNEVESILANRNNAIEAETAQVNEAVETTLNNSSYNLSDEIDENGRQFVLNSNGDTAFGWVDAESGLTPAPIMLSEGIITNPATNDGYGLVHIEARHGKQIRENGYASVLDFIEEVAKNYEVIREGKNRNGEQTYLLQLTDKHNNTLMVELSGDGTYWNINTAGVFKTSYGRNNKVVYNRQTTAKQPAEAIETSQSVEQNGTQSPSSLIDAPTPNVPSENKDTNSVPNVQELEQKNNAITIAENAGIKENDFATQLRKENPAEYNTFNALAKLLGLEIEFVESAGEGNALIVGNKMQVAYNPANRDEALRFLIGHESLHRLKQVAPEAYAELMEDVKAYMGEELFGRRKERLQQRYDKQGIAITEESLEEEVVADFIGEMEEDYNVISDLATQNPNKSWWQKLIEGLRNLFSFLEEAEADTTKVASILNKIETAYKAAAEKVQTLEVETVNGEVSAEEAKLRYSVKDIPSLVGVHNISLEKLRKVIKMGGSLANPSVAVLDIDRNDHTDYGEYSLILPKNMVDARLGRNVGTWAGDAWTPTYPPIIKRIKNSKDVSRFYKDINKLPEEIRNRVSLQFDSYLEGRDANSFYYWFLFENGMAPDLQIIPSRYSDEIVSMLQDATDGRMQLYGLSPEQRMKVLDVFIQQYYQGDKAEFEATLQNSIDRLQDLANHQREAVRKRAQQDLADIQEYGFDYDEVAEFVRDVERDISNRGRVDVEATIRSAKEYVEQNNLSDNFDKWRDAIEERYGIEEFIFNGYTPTGTRKYLPHTTENVSKYMKQQGRTGAASSFPSFGLFIATIIPRMTTLDSIRKRKGQLGNSEQAYNDFKEKWEDVYYGLGLKLQPDAERFEDYGFWRLIEAVSKPNPQKYIKDQYNIDFSNEDMATLNEMLEAIKKSYPARYFETKFERPVELTEFVAAVVPNNIPSDVEDYLRKSYLNIYKYDKESESSRREATLKAVDSPSIRFSLKDTFYSNAEQAVRNIKQEKATPEQWLKMIEKNGGLKAGEDKWLGLSDWLKEQMRGPIKEKPTTININGTEYNVKELEEQILSDIKAMLGEAGFEDKLIGIRLVGSYARGEQRPDSDIDVIVEYKGNSTEDTLFNVLNDEEHRINIGGVDVDINPITEGKSGTLDEWEKRNAGFTKKPITLTKDEVLDYIHQNQIQIEEVEYTADAVGFDALKAEYDALLRNEGYDAAHDTMIDRFGDDFDIAFSDLGGELIIENEEAAATLLGSGNIINSTRLEYTTNGLDNHREIALTVPTIEPWNTSDAVHFGDAGDGRAVAWIRFGETTDTEGKRVLVIDEIQSKRHQEGRERGYRSIQLEKEMLLAKEKLAKTNRELGDYKSGLKEKYDFKNIKGSFFERHQIFYGALLAEERAQLDTLAEKRNDAEAKWQSLQLKATGIPSAPFEKNWAELAMKRILRYAAENGYDKVAWTTGDQQSERYDLSHMVDYIDAERNVDGTYNINVATTDDSHYVQETNIAENKLSELVGKDIAFGIISSIENSDSNKAHIEADDMTIGGSGMKAFYDQMLPSFMRKYAKKWGATVGEVTMPNLEENNTMHSVDVTPAMRESVMQGQPMFSLRNPEWQSQFGVPLADGKELSLEDVRTIFEKTNKGKFYQKIFDRVYAVMEKLPRKVIKVVEELPDKRKVLGTASTKGDVTFRTVLFKNYGEQAIAETILHELIHSVTTYATHAYAKQATSEKHSKAYDALPAEIKKACRELQSVYNRLSKKNDLKGAYGIKNIHEMLAELSNPQFRTLVKEGGFWKVLLNALKRMFGFEGTYNAELAELDNILSSFLENYNEEAYMDAVESIYGEDIFTTIEEVDAKEMRKPFGGNSGYVGYSMSKRATYAREEGRYPKTDFKKVYNMPQATLDALVKEGVIYDKEWHHTSVYGNKTIFYGWGDDGEYPELAELYKERKKSIDKAVKDGADLSSFVEMFSKREEEIFEQRHLEYLAEVERVKQNVLARQQREEYIRKHIPSVIKASNGAEVYTNNSPYLSDWVATKDGERLSKRNRKEERDVAFNEVSKIVSAIGQEYDVASATSSLKDENKPLEGQYNALKETDNQGKEVKYSIADSVEVFDATRNLAVANIGIVMPNLSSKIVQIVKYSGEERPPIEKSNDDVLKWAKKNITTQDSYIVDSNGVRHDCPITANSVTEMLNNRAIKSSVNRNVHLLALPLLKAILANSIEVEIHPDYNKVDGERKPENGYNPDVLMHRFYGAVEIEGVIYRTKSTVKEYRDKNTELKPYTYEVTKIELLPNSTADTNNAHGRPLSIESNSIDATKLLQNISKSYDKEVKILDESVKNSLKSLDAPYLDAVARGDMATAERMVREAAAIAMPNTKVVDEDGLPKIVEHSTWNDDFYTFDINHLGESSGDEGVYGAGFYFGNVGETELYGDRAIQAYLNLHNPLVLPDAPIKGFFDYLVENFDKEGLRDIVVKQDNHTATMGDVVDAIKSVNEAHAQGKYAELIEQMSQYWMGAEGRVLEQLIFRKIGFAIYPTLEPFIQYNVGRKEFSEALRNAGYDGVVYNNQEYIAFEPNQIKSADVVTYDDAGNIIPLSERFNPEKEDIRYSLREATSEKLTPAMIRHHMMENVTRHHEQEVNRINRFYDREERQAKALAKKARKEAGLVYPKNGKITDRLAFLIPDGKTTLPMELQVTYDIANGLKLKWSDSKDGRKHGLSSELGLGSSRKEGYGAITVGATMYVEDYVAQLMEENSGYSRDLDDNDIRNAVINVLSQYTKPKQAIQALEDIFLSNEMDDAEAEALYKIDQRRQEALEAEEKRYAELKASYERNPRAFERDYFEQLEKDVVALNFKEREIRRLKRDIKALRNTHNKTYREQAERIQKVREAIDDFLKSTYGRNISTTEVKRLFDALQKATTQKQLERVIEAVSRMEKRTTDRIEQERKRRLLKMKLSFFIPADAISLEEYLKDENQKASDAAAIIDYYNTENSDPVMNTFRIALKDRYKGKDSSGVSVAKLIDAETAEIMAFISTNATRRDIVEANLAEEAAKLYEAKEKLKGKLPFSQSTMDKIDQAYEVVLDYWEADIKRQGAVSYHTAMLELSIKIEMTKKKRDKAQQDGNEKEYEEAFMYLAELMKETRELAEAYYGGLGNANKQLMEANDAVERLLLGGRRLLSEEREAKRKHDAEVLRDAINDITNYGEEYKELNAKAHDQRKASKDKEPSRLKRIHSEWADSLEYLLNVMAPYAPEGSGLTYQRIIGGALGAASTLYINTKVVNMAVEGAIKRIWGGKMKHNTLPKLLNQSQQIVLAEDYVIGYYEETEDGKKVKKPRRWCLTMGNAIYLLAMWEQPDSHYKLTANGVTQEVIDDVTSLIANKDARWIEFKNWVVDELLPARREVYDETHRKVQGTYMAESKNYFPIHILSQDRHQEEKASEEKAQQRSIKPSGIKQRVYNTNMIDLNVDFVKALMDNLYTMEMWAAIAPVEEDMNVILSNNTAKNLMNAKFGADFSQRLKTAMQVTVGTLTSGYINSTEKFFQDLTRRWGGTKIAFGINTALKQLAGAGAMCVYTTDWRFLWYLVKNIQFLFTPKSAQEFFPMLQKRWEEGLAGNIGLKELFRSDVTTSSGFAIAEENVNRVTTDIVKLGMIPNKIVDMAVCAMMAKSVYEYEYNRYIKQGYSKEMAEKKAMIDAESSYNKTQQSSEMAFLSSGQVSSNILNRSLNIFMNNSIANYRIGVMGIEDIKRGLFRFRKAQRNMRKATERRLFEQYTASGMAEEEARVKAQQEADIIASKLSGSSFVAKGFFRSLWGFYFANIVFGFMGIAPYLLFGDDDDKKKELIIDLLKSSVFTPLTLIPTTKAIYETFAYAWKRSEEGRGYQVSIAESLFPILEDVDQLITNSVGVVADVADGGDMSYAQIYNTIDALLRMGVGVDTNRMFAITDGFIDLGNGDWLEGTLDVLSVPKSQIKLLTGDRKDGETAKEYMTRVMRTMSIVDKNKIDVAELENYNFELGKWEKPTNISAAEKRKVSEIYRQYQAEYKKDMLKRCSEEVRTDYPEIVEKHAEILKDMGVQDTKLALVKYYEQMVDTLTPEAASALERLAVLQAEISATERSLDLLVSQDGKEYIDLLTEEFNLRKEFVAQYEIYKNLTE